MHHCNRLIGRVMACLLVLATLVATPAVVLAEIQPPSPQASCLTAGASAACVAGTIRDLAAVDGHRCGGSSAIDRHCCSAPMCLSVHGALMPGGLFLPADPGVPVEASAIEGSLVGAEPGPGMRPPRPRA